MGNPHLRLDNCEYCAATTLIGGLTIEEAIEELESGQLYCWLCAEDGEIHQEIDLLDGDRIIWSRGKRV